MTPSKIIIMERWTISDGPSREELFDSLRLRNEFRPVEFELLEPSVDEDGHGLMRIPYRKRVMAQILQIGAEDGSGHSWCVRVAFQSDQYTTITNTTSWIDIYYHDGRRRGAILDARPSEEKVHIDRNGDVWQGAYKIGNVREVLTA